MFWWVSFEWSRMVCQEFCLKYLGHHWNREPGFGDHVGEAFAIALNLVDSIRNNSFLIGQSSYKRCFCLFCVELQRISQQEIFVCEFSEKDAIFEIP